MSSDRSPSSDPVTHSEPIPINTTSKHRTRPRSASEASEEGSEPPLSPASESPASVPSIQTPVTPNSRVPVTPISPSSPILSYFYGSPNKTSFSGFTPSTRVFEDEESQEPPPTPVNPTVHGRRVSTGWVPVRFGPQQNAPATESQQERGAGVLRRLSLSGGLNRPVLPGPQQNGTPPNSPDGGTRKGSPRLPAQRRKAATLSAGTVDANKVPRAPSPMGERILKGFFDGF